MVKKGSCPIFTNKDNPKWLCQLCPEHFYFIDVAIAHLKIAHKIKGIFVDLEKEMIFELGEDYVGS